MKKLILFIGLTLFTLTSVISQACLPDGITLTTQSEIDNFQTNHPNCTEIEGDVTIVGDDITNLNGLSVLTSIGGDLTVGNGYLNNQNLTSLSGLDNVTSIGWGLYIFRNPVLPSLTGLDNIDASTIEYLYIHDNDSLVSCEVQSVCEYLASPTGLISIQDNAPGCNSADEVEDACMPVSVDEAVLSDKLLTHPNPFTTSTTIEYELNRPGTVRINIYNQLGGQVEIIEQSQQQGLNKIVWTPKNLPNGIYYFKLQPGEQVAQGKMVLMR